MLWPLSVLVANTNGRLAIPALAGLLVCYGSTLRFLVVYRPPFYDAKAQQYLEDLVSQIILVESV